MNSSSLWLCGFLLCCALGSCDRDRSRSLELSSTFINSVVNGKATSDCIDLYHNAMLHATETSDIKFQSNLDNLKFQTTEEHIKVHL